MRVPRSILERHHLSMRANDEDLTVPLCLNCHRKMTEAYSAAGVPSDVPDTLLDRLLVMLMAWEVFFADFGRACGTWGTAVRRLIEWCDDNLNGWRESTIWRDKNGPSPR